MIPYGLSKLILYENHEFEYSRDQVTVKMGQNLASGAVVAYDVNRKVVTFQTGVTGDPCGVMVFAIDATTADKQGVMLARQAIVRTDTLIWDAGETAPEKAAALVKLALDYGILNRVEI